MGLVQSYISILRNYKKYHSHALFGGLLVLATLQLSLWNYTRTTANHRLDELNTTKSTLERIERDYTKAKLTEKALNARLEELNAQEVTFTDAQINSIKNTVEKSTLSATTTKPEIRVITREEYASEIKSDVENQKPETETVLNFQAFLETFGLIERKLSEDEFLKSLLVSQTSFPTAFYNPDDKKLTLIKGLSNSHVYYRYNLAHEMTHFIQDATFKVKERTDEHKKTSTDKYLAYLALVEGQAEYATEAFLDTLNSVEVQELNNALRQAAQASKGGKITEYDRKKSEFVYGAGLQAIKSINNKDLVNSLLNATSAPTSKEILHPELLKNFKEQSVSIDYNVPTFSLKDSDVLGEIGCRITLSNLGTRAYTPCSYWQGDAYRLYRSNESRIVIYAISTKSSQEAEALKTTFESSLATLAERYFVKTDGNIMKLIVTNDENIDTKAEIERISINLTNP